MGKKYAFTPRFNQKRNMNQRPENNNPRCFLQREVDKYTSQKTRIKTPKPIAIKKEAKLKFPALRMNPSDMSKTDTTRAILNFTSLFLSQEVSKSPMARSAYKN